MRKIRSADHLTDEESAERTDKAEDKEQFRRWQALYIIKTRGLSSEDVAEIIRVSSGTVIQRVHLYNNNGEEALILKGRGGRRRCHMSDEEEKSFPERSEKEAEKGFIITAETVIKRAEEQSGHEVSGDYAYDLLHRHQRKKISPRSVHPEADKSKQEEYKKNFPIWLKKQQKHPIRMIKDR
ncbi:MAG: winged helix-turn-helix domain-containing protein [Desulfobacteraceae bacterium]|nr:winged helix-turn-helix domain-containing protein [Desulfobacteraceae bacterium]